MADGKTVLVQAPGVAETDRVFVGFNYDVLRSHRVRHSGDDGEKGEEYWIGDQTQL